MAGGLFRVFRSAARHDRRALKQAERSPEGLARWARATEAWRQPRNLVEKNASHQSEGLIRKLQERPDSRQYIDALRQAGRGST